MIPLLHENSNRFLYVTKKRIGEPGQEIIPQAGDLRDETDGCVISYEPTHGYVFSTHLGDHVVSSEPEATALYGEYCTRRANRYSTLVKRNPENGHEFVLDAKTIHKPRPQNALYLSWGLLVASVAVFVVAYAIRGGRETGGGSEAKPLARTRVPRYSRFLRDA